MLFFFFFQAEDGIRDADVTGVQTCALPIYRLSAERGAPRAGFEPAAYSLGGLTERGRATNGGHEWPANRPIRRLSDHRSWSPSGTRMYPFCTRGERCARP